MNCCLSCGGPLQPSREAMRRDKVGSRALNFIEGDAIAHKEMWNLEAKTDPTLVSVREDLHLFHTTNVQSAMFALVEGPLKDVWLDEDTPVYDNGLFTNGVPRANKRVVTNWINSLNLIIPQDMYVIGVRRKKSKLLDGDGDSKAVMKGVMWEKPDPLTQFDVVSELIEECVGNVGGNLLQRPNLNDVVAGCKMCNNIMTVLATSSHFLVRCNDALVKDNVILAIDAATQKKFTDKRKSNFQPNASTKGSYAGEYAYEACVAYYLHRCLPPKPRRLTVSHQSVRFLSVFFAWIVLQVLCLEFEKAKGPGGKDKRIKPAYRYRGCTEMYLAFFYWILLQNDNPEGTGRGAHVQRTSMPFYQFHRYFFTEVIDTLTLAMPDTSWACEVMDLVCEDSLDFDKDPHHLMGQLCNGMVNFYRVYLKPNFSRHLASLEPNPNLQMLDPTRVAQSVVRDRIIKGPDMTLLKHVLQGGTEGDVDTFIDSVGVTSVMKCWQRLLSLGEYKRTVQLLEDFMDAVVLTEYQNISQSMSSNPEAPSVSLRTAEMVYLLCSVLEIVSEPDTEEELQLLRVAPKRSPYSAVSSLQQVGAFKAGA
jgi:hypothetical protein